MRHRNLILSTTLGLLLAACNGGGGGGGSNSIAPPGGLSYPFPEGRFLVQVQLPALVPSVTGQVTQWSIAPALPPGLSLSLADGAIAGKPLAASERTAHVVTARGPGGQTQTTIHISVDNPPRFAFAANTGDDTLSTYLVDAWTGELRFHGFEHHGAIQSGPQEIVFHADGEWALVPNLGQARTPSSISVYAVDPDRGTLTHTFEVPTGEEPQRIAFAPDGKTAYALTHEDNRIHSYAFDASTGTLTLLNSQGTNTGPEHLAVDPEGRFVYVAHGPSADVLIFTVDPVTGALNPFADGINFWGFVPTDVVVDANGTHVYISFEGTNTLLAYTIDPVLGSLGKVSETALAGTPRDMALPDTGGFLYVANEDLDSVSIFALDPDTGSPTHLTDVPAGDAPAQVVFDESGRYAYVLNAGSDDVSVFAVDPTSGDLTPAGSIRTRSTASTFTVYGGPRPAQPRAEFLYVLNAESGDVANFQVDPSSGDVTLSGPNVMTGSGPQSAAIDPRGRFLFVANGGGTDVAIFAISPGSGILIETPGRLNLGATPGGLAVDAAGAHLFVSLRETGEVVAFAIDPGTGALSETDRASIGLDPRAVSVDPTGQYVYVANWGSPPHTYSALRVQDGLFQGPQVSENAPGRPGPLRFAPDGSRAYVALTGVRLLAAFDVDAADGTLTIDGAGATSTSAAPNVVEIHPDGLLAFAAVPGDPLESGHLARLAVDPKGGRLSILGTLPEGLSPWDLRMDPTGRTLFVVNEDGDDLTVFDVDATTGDLLLVSRSPAGLSPRAVLLTTRVD